MKTVLITGGSRGIGASLVKEFHDAGYRVIFLYCNSSEEAEKIEKTFDGTYAYCCDVSDKESVFDCVSSVLKRFGKIDVLVNNAGISYYGLLDMMSVEDWNKILNVNLTSVFLMCKALIPHFVSKKSGKIINISSMWGSTGASCEVAYSASKAGVDGFTKALAKELAPSGITVNAVSPGVIKTDMMSDFSESDIVDLCEKTPLGRIGDVHDVAQAVLFLASDASDFITGQIINVNGGFVI